MNKLKLIIGVILVFAVGTLAGVICTGFYFKGQLKQFFEEGPPMEMRIRRVLDEFSKDLDLSETQKTQIEKILRDAQESIFEFRRKTFPQIEALNEKTLELIREKLDEKQREKFNAFYNKMRNFQDRFAVRLDFPGRPFSPELDEMKTRLNLTPDQATRLETIMKENFNKREKIMQEGRDKQPPDFSIIRKKMTEIDTLENKKIEEILSGEQVESYRSFVEEKRSRRPPAPGPNPSNNLLPAPGPDHSNSLPPPPRW